MAGALDAVAGVTQVDFSTTTGSITVRYSDDDVPERLARALAELGIVVHPGSGGSGPSHELRPGERVAEVLLSVDASVRRVTRGNDLRLLVPLGLAGLSLRQALRDAPGLKDAPWYVLAWYAFDAFMKLQKTEGSSVKEA